MNPTNPSFHSQRTVILQQMAGLETMELGSLKAEYRSHPSGSKSGPYFKHQVWNNGANLSQRVSPEEALALETAINNRQKFEALTESFIQLSVEHTRQSQFPDSLKKKTCRVSSLRKTKSRS